MLSEARNYNLAFEIKALKPNIMLLRKLRGSIFLDVFLFVIHHLITFAVG